MITTPICIQAYNVVYSFTVVHVHTQEVLVMNARWLRTEIARLNIPKYKFGAEASINPVRLGAILNERDKPNEDEVRRIKEAVSRLSGRK